LISHPVKYSITDELLAAIVNIIQSNTLSPLRLIVTQELVASFASKRGLFVISVFILTWTWLLFYPISFAAEAMKGSQGGSFVFSALSAMGLESLNNWLMAEFAVYWIVALYVFPTFSLLMASDQMISERQRGGLRFLTLRCSRANIFFGRFLGHMLIQLLLLLATLAITYALLLINNSQYWLEGLKILPLLMLNIILVTSPFVALMSLLSIVMNSVRMSILVATIILVLAGVIINYAASYLPFLSLLNYWIPGAQVSQMAQLSPTAALSVLWNPAMQTLGLLAVGYGLFKRQAI
jgi:ABC-type transport system involved in multi-copper enzyme maturation permease subunit